VRGREQFVEKVGAELEVTTNRAPEAPKSPKFGVFRARSGLERAFFYRLVFSTASLGSE
jgi:hypothetical protein